MPQPLPLPCSHGFGGFPVSRRTAVACSCVCFALRCTVADVVPAPAMRRARRISEAIGFAAIDQRASREAWWSDCACFGGSRLAVSATGRLAELLGAAPSEDRRALKRARGWASPAPICASPAAFPLSPFNDSSRVHALPLRIKPAICPIAADHPGPRGTACQRTCRAFCVSISLSSSFVMPEHLRLTCSPHPRPQSQPHGLKHIISPRFVREKRAEHPLWPCSFPE